MFAKSLFLGLALMLSTGVAQANHDQRDRGAEVVGGIIGAIGDAIADQGRPHRPRPPRTEYVCYAQNMRGMVFEAYGFNPRRVQERAVDRCYDQSFRCRPLGCEEAGFGRGGWGGPGRGHGGHGGWR